MEIDQNGTIDHIEDAHNAHEPRKTKCLGQLTANQGSCKLGKKTQSYCLKISIKIKLYPNSRPD